MYSDASLKDEMTCDLDVRYCQQFTYYLGHGFNFNVSMSSFVECRKPRMKESISCCEVRILRFILWKGFYKNNCDLLYKNRKCLLAYDLSYENRKCLVTCDLCCCRAIYCLRIEIVCEVEICACMSCCIFCACL